MVLNNHEPELSYKYSLIFFHICLEECCFLDYWKGSSVVPVFKDVGESSTSKNSHRVSLLSVDSKIFEKRVNSRYIHHLEKHGHFSDF